MRIGLVSTCLLSTVFTLAVGTPSAEPLKIGSHLELFVDDYLIEFMEGLELKLHSPRPAERVLTFDKPWEGVTSDYISVLKDDDRYRMYYRGSTHAGKGLTIRPLLLQPTILTSERGTRFGIRKPPNHVPPPHLPDDPL